MTMVKMVALWWSSVGVGALELGGGVRRRPVRLLTFDLDDTLFPCGAVVDRANAALVAALLEVGVTTDAAAIQGRIASVRRSAPVPMTYSAMRTAAIEALAPAQDARRLFATWLEERQRASNDLLFAGAPEALEACRDRAVVVGAVTNGRGDPRAMGRVAPFFDFTLSGEDDGVFPDRKPSSKIYEHALRRAADASGCPVEDLRRSWVHVGDCLVNDVAASKEAGATTIWLDRPDNSTSHQNSFSTASDEEAADRLRKRRDARSKVDLRIDEIGSVHRALESLRLDGAATTAR